MLPVLSGWVLVLHMCPFLKAADLLVHKQALVNLAADGKDRMQITNPSLALPSAVFHFTEKIC